MIVKYCPKCFGRPYTKDFSMSNCPNCNAVMQSEMVDEHDLDDRAVIEQNESFSGFGYGFGDYGENNNFNDERKTNFSGFTNDANDQCFGEIPQKSNNYQGMTETSSTTTPVNFSSINESKKFNNTVNSQGLSRVVKGKVSQYSSTGKEDGEYRRLLPIKIYQALVYRQRLEDVLHRFTVRVERGEDALGYQQYTDIPVNVHGTIAGGLQIVDNAEVEVHGKYRNGILMADDVHIINNGYKSKVGFQHSVKAITYGILSAVMLAFICFVAATSNGSFIANIKEFCTVWLVIAAILTVLYLITSLTKIGLLTRIFLNKRQTFPIFGILLISLALAFLFVSIFGSLAGFGSYLSGWIYSLVPIIIIVVALFFIIKSMF